MADLEPMIVKEINSSGSDDIYELTAVNNKLFFRAQDSSGNSELWMSDGTAAGTVKVKEINPATNGFIGSNPRNLTVFNNKLFFSAEDSSGNSELWMSDGTAAGTVKVKEINPATSGTTGSHPYNLTVFNNKLFFSAEDSSFNSELWMSDGTEAGTVKVKEINPTLNSHVHNLFVFNGKLFFSAQDTNGNSELWVSDGSEAGTVKVKEINPGTSGSDSGSNPRELTVYNNKLFFHAQDSSGNSELWMSDGTAAGTVKVKEINPATSGNAQSFPRELTVYNDKLFFIARDTAGNDELWMSDGTEAGTVNVKEINPATNSGSQPYDLTVFNGKLYFSARENSSNSELWMSDGTAAGTVKVKEISPGDGSADHSSPYNLTVFNGKLYFSAQDRLSNRELWVSDGTEAGTVKVKELNPTAEQYYDSSSNPDNLIVVNNTLFFTASDGTGGTALWKLGTPNTTPATVDIIDVAPDPTNQIVDSVTIEVSDGSGLDVADLSFAYNGQNINLTQAKLTQSTATHWILSNLSSLEGGEGGEGEAYIFGEGTYTLAVNENINNGLTAIASETWIVDQTAPTAIALTPQDNATAVPVNTNLTLEFNEAIVKGTGKISLATQNSDGSYSLIEEIDVASAQVTVEGKTVTVNPSKDLSFLAETKVFVSVGATALQDLAGNPFAGFPYSDQWDFIPVKSDAPVNPPIDQPPIDQPQSHAIVVKPVADQLIKATSSLLFTLPKDTFTVADGRSLKLSATLADGSALPTWLLFDSAAGSFSGTAGKSNVGRITVKVTATHTTGEFVSENFILSIEGETGIPLSQLQMPQKFQFKKQGSDKSELLRGGLLITDSLQGNGGNDVIFGGISKALVGKDHLRGGDGNDVVFGGLGSDLLEGDSGEDVLIGGKGKDELRGSAGADFILGGKGKDVLVGGEGSDLLVGDASSVAVLKSQFKSKELNQYRRYLLDGSKVQDKDMFVFEQVNEGVDTIVNFDIQQDVIDLRQIFAQAAYDLDGASSFARFEQFIKLEQTGTGQQLATQVRIDADGTGAGTTLSTLAVLRGVERTQLTSENFIIN
jgi:ELWxxDGT repeat protein